MRRKILKFVLLLLWMSALAFAQVTSWDGRTGAVVPTTGDYTCLMVTGCLPPLGTIATVALAVDQTSSQTTATVTVNVPLTSPGWVLIDSEWEYFTSTTSLGGGEYTLNGITRGQFATTSASHTSGTPMSLMIVPFANPADQLNAFVGDAGAQTFFNIACPSVTSEDADIGTFSVGCPGSNFAVGSNGVFTAESPYNFITGSVQIGSDVGAGQITTLDSEQALTSSANVLQNNQPNAVTSQISFTNGIPGGVKSTQAPTAPAPILNNIFVPSGSTTYTGYCGGTDELGGNIPGTPASILNIASSGWITPNQHIEYQCIVPGAATTYFCRTSGGPNVGIIATASGATLAGPDDYNNATGACPSNTNTTIAHVCTNGLQYCVLSGTTSTPPLSCSSAGSVPTAGWSYYDTSAPGTYTCNGTTSTWTLNSGEGGIASINGSTASAQTIVGSGSVSVSTVGSTTTVSASGEAGSGAVTSEPAYADGGYQSAGTTIGSQGNSLTVPNGLSSSQMQSAVTATSSGQVLHINGPEPPFTNSGNANIQDNRVGIRVKYLTEYGAACDAVPIYGTTLVTASITSFSITSDVATFTAANSFVAGDTVNLSGFTTGTYFNGQAVTVLSAGLSGTQFEADFTHANVGTTSDTGTGALNANVLNGYGSVFAAGDAGSSTTAKWISIVYGPAITGGASERFDAYVTAVDSASQVTLSAPAPYATGTGGDWTITYGHDDTTPIAEGMAASKGQFTVGVPTGPGECWSRQNGIRLNGQSITGNGKAYGGLLGGAGFDTLLADDPSETSGYTGQGTPGQDIGNFAIYFDARIDASLPWVFDNNGTITDEAANYRPVGTGSASVNLPFGPGWIRGSEPFGLGGNLGVASLSASSAVMCVITGATPAVGDSIVFPYLTNVFQTTVASTAGSCGTGTPITLSAAPSSGAVTQAEYYFGEAPSASPTGTAIQELATAIPATGRSYPMTIDLVNSINPEPGAETDFAPFGMFKVDGEHFYYYGNSTYPANFPFFVTVTSSLENGTGATGPAHAIDAAIVAVNAYQPTWPWPSVAIGGVPTPPNAEPFAAYNIGNCGLASPVYNGTGWNGSATFYRAKIHDLAINAWPVSVFPDTTENLTGYQEQNDTCGMYFGGTIPFNTEFASDIVLNPFYGIVEGGPSILNNNWYTNGYPTADQTNWHHIAINAAVDFDFIGGGTNSWDHFQLFSQSGGVLGPYQATLVPSYLGAVTAGQWTPSPTNDLDGTGGIDTQSSACHHSTQSNFYLEAETGSNAEKTPMWEDDCDNSNWKDQGDISGGTEFIGGHNSIYTGAFFNNGANAPLIVDGSTISLQHAFTTNENSLGNVFGTNSLLIWGTNDCAQSDLSIGGDNRISYGNCSTPSIGQTQEFAEFGNLATPAVNNQSGWFPASALNVTPDAGGSQAWTFDNTPTNLTQGYLGCDAGTVGATQYCTVYPNGNTTGDAEVGPGQQLAAQKYIWTLGLRTSGGSAQTVSMYVSDCHGYIDTTHTAIPISSSWTNVQVGIIDFSASSGCGISFTVNGLSSTAEQVQIGYSSFVPLPQNLNAQQITIGSGTGTRATIFSGSGAPTGCGTTYANGSMYLNTAGSEGSLVYICIGSTWTDVV